MGKVAEAVTILLTEFPTAREAVRSTGKGTRRAAISVGGHVYVSKRADIDRLVAAGVELAYLIEHEMPDGTHRMMTIPVND